MSGEIFVEAARLQGRKTIRLIRQSGLSSAESLMLGTTIAKLQTLGSWGSGRSCDATSRSGRCRLCSSSFERKASPPRCSVE
jgi:hypothetical protein